ncbi:MAG: lysophospholipid acyltransferase family protein [Leptospira sp.]|jgi:1-acyl-sn-glycerol-3-phosphate acyltransferase|nr:lysophospholipid acyltransferase family protein [Leptospira sp.]
MFRTIGFYTFFFIRGFFSFIARWKAKRVSLPTVDATDWERNQVPRSWAKGLLKIVGADIQVHGDLQYQGPVLFVANHVGSFDIPVLISSLPKAFGFISKIEVLKIPIVGSWMKIMNCVFMDRKSRTDSTKAIEMGVKVLKEGHSLLIFPEGTRSKGGEMKAFKAGSFRLALDAGVPIIPLGITGTADVMEKNKGIMKPAKIHLTILPLQPYSSFKDMTSKDLAEHIHQMIHKSINSLEK